MTLEAFKTLINLNKWMIDCALFGIWSVLCCWFYLFKFLSLSGSCSCSRMNSQRVGLIFITDVLVTFIRHRLFPGTSFSRHVCFVWSLWRWHQWISSLRVIKPLHDNTIYLLCKQAHLFIKILTFFFITSTPTLTDNNMTCFFSTMSAFLKH